MKMGHMEICIRGGGKDDKSLVEVLCEPCNL